MRFKKVEHWEQLVSAFMKEHEYNIDIFITGFNSKMMSSKISTYLTGRYVSFPICVMFKSPHIGN